MFFFFKSFIILAGDWIFLLDIQSIFMSGRLKIGLIKYLKYLGIPRVSTFPKGNFLSAKQFPRNNFNSLSTSR